MSSASKYERALDSERVSVRLSPRARAFIEEIKANEELGTDADVIRHALAVYHRISQAKRDKDRLVLYGEDGELKGELVFVTAP